LGILAVGCIILPVLWQQRELIQSTLLVAKNFGREVMIILAISMVCEERMRAL
jgi:hypothetical protein